MHVHEKTASSTALSFFSLSLSLCYLDLTSSGFAISFQCKPFSSLLSSPLWPGKSAPGHSSLVRWSVRHQGLSKHTATRSPLYWEREKKKMLLQFWTRGESRKLIYVNRHEIQMTCLTVHRVLRNEQKERRIFILSLPCWVHFHQLLHAIKCILIVESFDYEQFTLDSLAPEWHALSVHVDDN